MCILLCPDHFRTLTIPIPTLQAHIGPAGVFILAFHLSATTGDTGTPDIGPADGVGTNLVVSAKLPAVPPVERFIAEFLNSITNLTL